MRDTFAKGIFSILVLVLVIMPASFYVAYANTSSVFWSLLAVLASFLLWKVIVGGGLRKRRKCVDMLMAENFPTTEDDPLSDPGNMFKKDWLRGAGYTNEIDQPMCVKVTENGIGLFYLCRASKMPFVVPWDRISQIKVTKETYKSGQALARLYIPGVGLKILVPWEDRFSELIPSSIACDHDRPLP